MNTFSQLTPQRLHLMALLLFGSLFLPSFCSAWPGKVISVADGDTITVLHDGKEEKIRLHGIDCPEGDQPFGDKATALTISLVNGRTVDVVPVTIDKYGRTVGLVTIDSQSLNESIIRNGYAWVFTKYCEESYCSNWSDIESNARKQKKGMWNSSVVIPPWEWRASKKERNREYHTASDAPVIIMGEKSRPTPEPSIWAKVKGALTGSNTRDSDSSTANQYRCDGRTYCSQMTSCEEAKFFLQNCPGAKMDGNHDGVPCEKQWCH